ncbi:MAG: hypothetical protein COB77_05765 [Gammaproteobacteria bacterium]|nr:MAG: hypothetical protein COB77_05765 [Gammaproteobacteria bacterium]
MTYHGYNSDASKQMQVLLNGHSTYNHGDLLPTVHTMDNDSTFRFIKWRKAINENNASLLRSYYNQTNKEDFSQSNKIVFGLTISDFTLDIVANDKTERHNLKLAHFIALNTSLKFVRKQSVQSSPGISL